MRPDRSLTILAILLLAPSAARGHVESGVIGDGGFISGMLHPVTGLDHIVAMVAVGLWGAVLGQRAIWVLPVVFPLVMAFGSILGIVGIPLPAINVGVALSGVILGTMVTTCARPPLAISALLVSVFAVYHGYPHGSVLPDFGVPILYVSGFVLSTGLLHICGITLGLLCRWRAGMIIVRLSGAVIAAVGGYYLLAAVGFAPAA